jgi:peptidoglycan/xylan/chitin deacetylase (PgdA/CDA1 family)
MGNRGGGPGRRWIAAAGWALAALCPLSFAADLPAPAKPSGAVPVLMYHMISDGSDRDCFEAKSCAGRPRPVPAPVSEEILAACGASASTASATGAFEPTPPDPGMVVSVKSFERQMRFLRDRGWRALTLDEVFNARVPLTGRDVVLTFDDGYADAYAVAFPILRKHGLKGNLFMVSDNVGRPGRLNAAQLRDMDAHGFAVYAHTKTHANLKELSSPARCVELRASKAELEALLRRRVDFVAYPYGDFDAAVEQAARSAGYAATFSVEAGFCARGPKRGFLRCPRWGVGDADEREFRRVLGASREP